MYRRSGCAHVLVRLTWCMCGCQVQQRRALHLERLVLAEWRSEARIRRGLVMCAAAVKLLRARRRAAGVRLVHGTESFAEHLAAHLVCGTRWLCGAWA